VAKESAGESNKLAEVIRTKAAEMNELSKEKDKWKIEFEKAKEQSMSEMTTLRRQAEEAKARFEELSRSKGAETQHLVAQFNAEKASHEERLREQQQSNEALKNRLMELKAELERLRSDQTSKDEEIAVLQAGMDQSLMALQQLTQKGSDAEADLMNKIDHLNLEHRSQMDKIMGKPSIYFISVYLNFNQVKVLKNVKLIFLHRFRS
jgi:hypothetical protein